MLFSCQTTPGAPVRNYIYTLFQRIEVHADDGGGNTFDTIIYGAGGDVAGLNENTDADKYNLQNSFPTYSFTYNPGPPVTAYWLFDKSNVVKFAQFLASYFYPVCIEVKGPPELGIFHPISDPLAPDLKPRKGWTDDIGVKRKPPPSEKKEAQEAGDFEGADTLVEALQGLLRLASDLASIRKIREAGIVIYAYNQVIRNTWSITEAIQYLIDSGITTTIG
jgi:hypothetical protein